MAKTSSKVSISRLVKICAIKGLQNVVISPGSRNAPLILSFAEDDRFNCINIPDERVAAFYGLGMAQATGLPVILCCTSGTAALNYAPAIAEAYHQMVPLLILTADRPIEWIDQRAGQTLKQKNVFQNYIKKSFEILEEAKEAEHIWYNDRIVNEAINTTLSGAPGPVHINLPMREPLYDLVAHEDTGEPKIIHETKIETRLHESERSAIINEWVQYQSVLIIVGQKNFNQAFDDQIEKLAELPNVIVLTEATSNVRSKNVLPSIDRVIDSISPDVYADFQPELIISCGHAIVSKKIRFMLRQMHVKGHWHVDTDDGVIDTYQALTKVIACSPEKLFELLNAQAESHNISSTFKALWLEREVSTKQKHKEYLAKTNWTDLKVIEQVLEQMPSGILHLASSTPIRYAQLFDHRLDVHYKSNRGVSGIDGCTSTAMGYASMCDECVTLITGDIAFFYDSNALWQHHVPGNINIILINNAGGNIFRYVKGPDKTAHLEQHFEATHETSAKHMAKTFGIHYAKATSLQELSEALQIIYGTSIGRASILEISTPREVNIEVLKDYFQFLKDK